MNKTTRFTKRKSTTPGTHPHALVTMTSLGVTSGGDPSQWHGAFDCVACGRKRLLAVEFSASAVAKNRKDPSKTMRCKKCTSEAEVNERALSMENAKLKVKESESESGTPETTHECAKCGESKPALAFSNKQLNQKGPGKQRCRECCDAAEAAEASSSKTTTETKLKEAREASKHAELTNASDKLAVFAKEAALEAELVTGLKPQKIGGRGGRGGRGRGRGSNPNSMLGRGGAGRKQ